MTETKLEESVTKPPTAGTPANVYDHSAPAATAETKAVDDDVESQKDDPTAPASEGYDDKAAKCIGIGMFTCIVMGFALGWIGGAIGYWISFICLIVAIVLASIITWGCCCGSGSSDAAAAALS
eukprot:scaffold16837_cov82-Skeletonema_dohrnii-CCMP3373.AAC.6